MKLIYLFFSLVISIFQFSSEGSNTLEIRNQNHQTVYYIKQAGDVYDNHWNLIYQIKGFDIINKKGEVVYYLIRTGRTTQIRDNHNRTIYYIQNNIVYSKDYQFIYYLNK